MAGCDPDVLPGRDLCLVYLSPKEIAPLSSWNLIRQVSSGGAALGEDAPACSGTLVNEQLSPGRTFYASDPSSRDLNCRV